MAEPEQISPEKAEVKKKTRSTTLSGKQTKARDCIADHIRADKKPKDEVYSSDLDRWVAELKFPQYEKGKFTETDRSRTVKDLMVNSKLLKRPDRADGESMKGGSRWIVTTLTERGLPEDPTPEPAPPVLLSEAAELAAVKTELAAVRAAWVALGDERAALTSRVNDFRNPCLQALNFMADWMRSFNVLLDYLGLDPITQKTRQQAREAQVTTAPPPKGLAAPTPADFEGFK